MILFFYNIALLAVLILGLPFWLWRIATTQKYREGLRARLGFVPANLSVQDKPVLWLHAVSVGEVLAVSRLVSELEATLPQYRLLISTTTRTGQTLARQRFGADRVFYCPLDLPWAVRAYLNAIQPKLLILAETEFWPNLLTACFRRRIPVAVVNARISDRSFPRYRALRALWEPFLSPLSAVLAQSDLDAQRLRAIGCDPARVHVSGNLKYDVRTPTESEAVRELQTRAALSTHPLRFVVAGSTLDGEESDLLVTWLQVLAADPNLVLILAPRHPERFPEVATLLDESGLAWSRRSDWSRPSDSEPEPNARLHRGQVVLLDTIGELASVYSLAALALVGGSWVPAGGHNPLEPAQFSVPVVMGPSHHNFRAIVEALQAADAIRITPEEGLAATLIALLTDPAAAQSMGQRAHEVFERQSGATARSVAAIRALLETTA